MKMKQLVILCVLLCVLIGLVVLKKAFTPHTAIVDEHSNIIQDAITLDSIDEVYVRVGRSEQKKEIECKKSNGQWQLVSHHGAPVMKDKLESFVKLIDLLEGDLRSNDVMLLTDYSISDEKGIYILLKNEDQIVAELVLGTKKAGYTANFVRIAGSNAVYSVNQNLLGELGIWDEEKVNEFDDSVWVDKRFLVFDKALIKKIRFESTHDVAFLLQKEGDTEQGVWTSSPTFPSDIDSSKVMSFLEALAGHQAEAVFAKEGDYGFDTPFSTLVFSTAEKDIQVVIGKSTETGDARFVSVSDIPFVYAVSHSTLAELIKNSGDFFIHNPFGIVDSKIDLVTFRDIENGDECSVKRLIEETKYMEGDTEKTRRDTVWRIDNITQPVIGRDKVKRALQELEDISLRVTDSVGEVKDGNVFVVSIQIGDTVTHYSFSKPLVIGADEYHVVDVSNDDLLYVVKPDFLVSLRGACAELFETARE